MKCLCTISSKRIFISLPDQRTELSLEVMWLTFTIRNWEMGESTWSVCEVRGRDEWTNNLIIKENRCNLVPDVVLPMPMVE